MIGILKSDLVYYNIIGTEIRLKAGTKVRMLKRKDVVCKFWREDIRKLELLGVQPVPFRVFYQHKVHTFIGTPESVGVLTGQTRRR